MINSVLLSYYIMFVCGKKGQSYNEEKIYRLLYMVYNSWLKIKKEQLTDQPLTSIPTDEILKNVIADYRKFEIDNFNFREIPDEAKEIVSKVVEEFGYNFFIRRLTDKDKLTIFKIADYFRTAILAS